MGSSSKSSNQTSTKYQTQNISAPGAERIAGGNMTITETSKPALAFAATAMGITKSIAATALNSNVDVANNSMDKLTDVVNLSYRQATNQAENLHQMTDKALTAVANAKQSPSDNNTALLIKYAVILGGVGVVIIAVRTK